MRHQELGFVQRRKIFLPVVPLDDHLPLKKTGQNDDSSPVPGLCCGRELTGILLGNLERIPVTSCFLVAAKRRKDEEKVRPSFNPRRSQQFTEALPLFERLVVRLSPAVERRHGGRVCSGVRERAGWFLRRRLNSGSCGASADWHVAAVTARIICGLNQVKAANERTGADRGVSSRGPGGVQLDVTHDTALDKTRRYTTRHLTIFNWQGICLL